MKRNDKVQHDVSRFDKPNRTDITVEEVVALLREAEYHRSMVGRLQDILDDWCDGSSELDDAYWRFIKAGGISGDDFLAFSMVDSANVAFAHDGTYVWWSTIANPRDHDVQRCKTVVIECPCCGRREYADCRTFNHPAMHDHDS